MDKAGGITRRRVVTGLAAGAGLTTQALLVSLFLAPVSKDGSQVLARADASAQDGGTRQR